MASSTSILAGRDFRDERGNRIVPGKELGKGGEGVVHRVNDRPDSVVKIWHPDKVPPNAYAKIQHMVENPVEPGPRETWRITWPQHLVLEKGVIVGYMMPLLDRKKEEWEPIVAYYNPRAARNTQAAQRREIGIPERVRMAQNLALGFGAVHDAKYVIGDVNEKNVEVSRLNDIALVDCDSYGFTVPGANLSFSNNMGRPEFQAPEAQGQAGYANRTQNHDLFGLAVIIFQLLTGYHPYMVTGEHAENYPEYKDRIKDGLFPPTSFVIEAPTAYTESWEALTDDQKKLFRRCFHKWNYHNRRPSPDEWLQALRQRPATMQPDPTVVMCPQCNRPNSVQLVYCETESCAAVLDTSTRYCDRCKKGIPVKAVHCPECGEKTA